MSELNICPNCTGAGGDNNTWTCGMCGGTGGVPTASVDAEPVAWLHHHPRLREPVFSQKPLPRGADELGWTETPLYTEAQMQARADAARQEGAWEAGKEINALKDALAQARAEIAELKENPNAG